MKLFLISGPNENGKNAEIIAAVIVVPIAVVIIAVVIIAVAFIVYYRKRKLHNAQEVCYYIG